MNPKSALYLLILFFVFSISVRAQDIPLPPPPSPAPETISPKNSVVAASAVAEKSDYPPDFKTDGCTLWFDANFRDCCVQHDLDYWNWYKTGGWRGRLRADNQLFTCIAGKGFFQKGMAPFMWVGVRVFGSPLFPGQKGNVIYKTSKRVIRFFRKGSGGQQTSNKKKPAAPEKVSAADERSPDLPKNDSN